MKPCHFKTICILIFLFSANYLSAQITVTKLAKPQEAANTEQIRYDSTKNWLGDKNIESYIGQTLYVNGRADELRKYGYSDFHNEREEGSGKHYGHHSELSKFSTKYEDLFGRYFIIDEVYKDKSYSSFLHDWWFLLHEKDNPDVKIWFKYSEEFEHSWPFIVVSYFEYLKSEYTGKKYISSAVERATTDDEKKEYGNKRIVSEAGDTDIQTGDKIIHTLTDIWECMDITIEDEYYSLVLVVKNQKGQTSLIPVEITGQQKNGTYRIYEKSVYDKYVKRFGTANMNRIIQGEIVIGMTEEMLELSWGKPNKINSASYGPDQWVYDRQYVYVKNGIITAWN